MSRLRALVLVVFLALLAGPAALMLMRGERAALGGAATQPADVLLVNGRVLDGAGNPWVQHDVAVTGDRITFVGHARSAGVTARDTLYVTGLVVAPGFWDVHSHAMLETPEGQPALHQLYQGITTVVLGLDGGGSNDIDGIFAQYERDGIGVNALHFVGHNAARRAVMGMADRAPTVDELAQMKAYVRQGMEQGAFGLSSGLFYTPGYYAQTDEVIELNRVAAEYGGIYDTHDRDLGATYKGIGYVASVQEGIEIGERAGTPVIFSHFNPQGAHNREAGVEGARLIEEARARGVNVMAGQHPYMATQSNLAAYALPRWAVADGNDAMRARFADPEQRRRLDVETMEMLEIRGGPEMIRIVDADPALNGRTLAQLAAEWRVSVPETVRRIMAERNVPVMNLELYGIENTKYLAQQEWMMTCTDGRTPMPGQDIVHPRVYGGVTRKLRMFVYDEPIITLPFAVRGLTSLPGTFYNVPQRGMLREGWYADIVVFDEARLRDLATYESPHHYSEGMVHVLVNGELAIRGGAHTGALAGRPIRRGER